MLNYAFMFTEMDSTALTFFFQVAQQRATVTLN